MMHTSKSQGETSRQAVWGRQKIVWAVRHLDGWDLAVGALARVLPAVGDGKAHTEPATNIQRRRPHHQPRMTRPVLKYRMAHVHALCIRAPLRAAWTQPSKGGGRRPLMMRVGPGGCDLPVPPWPSWSVFNCRVSSPRRTSKHCCGAALCGFACDTSAAAFRVVCAQSLRPTD